MDSAVFKKSKWTLTIAPLSILLIGFSKKHPDSVKLEGWVAFNSSYWILIANVCDGYESSADLSILLIGFVSDSKIYG